jgi:hypothetical protein
MGGIAAPPIIRRTTVIMYSLLAIQLFLSIHIQKLQAHCYAVKYSTSVIICACGALILTATHLDVFTGASFVFLKDYRFYLAQFFNIAMVMIQIEGRKKHEKNMAVFYFSSFLIISVVPLLVPVLTHFLDFKKSVSVTYGNPYSMYEMVACMLVLTVIYYLNKIKSVSQDGIWLLVLNVFFGSIAIILGAKLIQEYNSIGYLIASNIFSVGAFMCLALSNGEHKRLSVSSFPPVVMAQMIVCFTVTLYFSALILQSLAVESYTILRNVGIILMSYLYTWAVEKNKTHNLRDSVLLTFMILTLVIFSS